MFQAGTAEVDITPPPGTWLIGCEGPSTGVHDPLMARVLILQSGAGRLALISLDLCGLAREDSEALRTAAAEAAGTDAHQVVLLLSHTHSAPFSIPWSVTGWQRYRADDAEWMHRLRQHIAEAAAAAAGRLAPAHLRVGRATVQIGMNRRLNRTQPGGQAGASATEAVMEPNPAGAVVPWSDVVLVTSAGGAPLAVLYSQAAHPVMVHRSSTLIGADYPGWAGQRIRERLGAGVMPLFAMGCGADNNAPLATGFERCRQAGIELGDAVVDTCRRAVNVDTTLTQFTTAHLELPLKPYETEDELVRAVADADAKALPQHHDMHPAARTWAQEAVLVRQDKLRILRDGYAPASMPFEIDVLAFGADLAIVALSHEVFAGYQLAIDRLSPFRHTVVWAYCNVTENYIPTDDEHSRGGYEISGGPLEYRYRTGPAPGAEALILARVSDMLHKAWASHAMVARPGASSNAQQRPDG